MSKDPLFRFISEDPSEVYLSIGSRRDGSLVLVGYRFYPIEFRQAVHNVKKTEAESLGLEVIK